jgi:protein-S-isoprenylcysteine O-methyltransferase Ste14
MGKRIARFDSLMGSSAFEGILFLVGTAGLIYVSRASLRTPASHGFYRFFAWEALLILFLLNLKGWFRQPFSAHQIVSWLLLLISLVLVGLGVNLLGRKGKPGEGRQDAPLLGIEKTTALVTEGVYHYIRHPLYSSLLFLGWGIFFKQPSWLGGLLAVIASVFLVLTARVEERENLRYFGEAYRVYMQHSRMFIPFVW